jgi:hypothetical protein
MTTKKKSRAMSKVNGCVFLALAISAAVLGGCGTEEISNEADSTQDLTSNITVYNPEAVDSNVVGEFSPDEEKRVLSALFPSYLTSQDQCSGQALGSLQEAQAAGQFVPHLVNKVVGAFTQAGTPQTLYLVSLAECNASHADNFGSQLLAVFGADSQVVGRAAIDGGSQIHRAVDVDADSRQEVVLESSFSQGGYTEGSATLGRVDADRFEEIEVFGGAYSDDCARGEEGADGAVTYTLITVAGNPLRFRSEEKTSTCD